MTGFTPDSDRRLLPRFRASAAAVSSGDLQAFQQRSGTSSRTPSADFDALKRRWAIAPTPDVASELVCSGIVLNCNEDVRGAAEYVQQHWDQFVPDLVRLATTVLDGDKRDSESKSETSLTQSVTYRDLACLKARLAADPGNAIVWMDRAHLHTTLGQLNAAERAVGIALALAPNNRFVLRSACRFYVRADDQEQGLYILRRAPALRTDPWLMSAEIALASVNQQSPASYKRARALLEEDALDPWHTAELNGAFGTLAMHDRGVGKAGQFFRRSLRNPTENAIAQAQWFSNNNNSGFAVPQSFLAQHMSFEAQALKARADHRWLDVLEACRGWSVIDPTSSRPLLLGSYIAEIALCDGRAALEFTRRWIVTDPASPIAWNNHAVALVYAGELESAKIAFARVAKLDSDNRPDAVYLATQGLIAYRSGDCEAGRRLYLEAAASNRAQKDPSLRALVLWHLLREETRLRGPAASELVNVVWEKTRNLPVPELGAMKALIEQAPLAMKSRSAVVAKDSIQMAGLAPSALAGYLNAPS